MTQQGLRQKTVRALTGRALTYVGDWHALFDQEGIPTGTYEGRQLRWLNRVMGTAYASLGQARQAFAELNGAFNWRSLGTWYLPDTISIIAAMNAAGAAPTGARAALINGVVAALQTSGAWAKLDGFYMLAAHAAAAARINWKNPGTFNLTAVNSPTFTVDQGYAGDGVSAYLETNFNPATAGGNFTRDSSHAGVIVQDAQGAASDAVFGNDDNIISPWRTGPQMLIRSSSTSSQGITISGAQAVHKGFSRTGAAGYTPYEDGAALTAVTQASSALVSRSFLLLARNSLGGAATPSTRRLFAAHFGGGLTAAQMLSIRNAIATYRTALGT